MAAGKKNAARLGAHLVFLDESGFLLIPSVRKTWAPRGQTPLLRCWQRHDKLSVISAVSVSPQRRRLGLYYQLHPTNIHQAEVCAFLRHLLRHLRGPVVILWDNGRIHRGQAIRDFCRVVPPVARGVLPRVRPRVEPG